MFAPSQLNKLAEGSVASLADDLDQHPLAPPPVELAAEDLLPRAEVELPARYRNNHLASHHLTLQVRVPVSASRSARAICSSENVFFRMASSSN